VSVRNIDTATVTAAVMRLSVETESATLAPGAKRHVPRHGLPPLVNRAQAYYWTHAWQEGEATSLGDLERGDVLSFRSGDDAVRWLLSTDDE
jgi:hypothetical protein